MSNNETLGAAVCDVLSAIPAGRVATYGDVGRLVGIGPRQAGREVGRVPDDVPWWRVVRSDGQPGRCHGGVAVDLLRAEGVPMRGDRVDLRLARHAWQ